MNGPVKYSHGTYWYKNGKYHREDGPAVELADGSTRWYKNGKYHREDGPAVELADGTVEYWLVNKQYSYDEWLEKRFWHRVSSEAAE